MRTVYPILRLVSALLLLLCFAAATQAGQTWITINKRSGLPSNNLTCMAITSGKMAVGSDNGVGLFIEGYDRWFNLTSYSEKLVGLAIKSIDFDEYGNIWVATPGGVFCIELERFPDEGLLVTHYATENGLSTVDTEVLQIVGHTLYVGCFGGWLFKTNIFQKAVGIQFSPVNAQGMGHEEQHRIMSVGITALAMDFPGGGIYSTKGKGLLRAVDGQSYTRGDELPSDWVNDFWSFSNGKSNHVIAVTQDKMNLIKDGNILAQAELPEKDCWISCLTTSPDIETEAMNTHLKDEDRPLDEFLGDRILYVGTRGMGIWMFDEGEWTHYTSRDCPLPSDNINKIYFIPGANKVAVLSDAGLTMFGLTDEFQYDEFEHRGSTPFFAKTFWPFMTSWGPYVYGSPDQMYYPIEPFISYRKLVRGKDLWVSHDKGLSRFVFPSSPFLGAIQNYYRLAGRFEAKENYPEKSVLIEDNSTAADRPVALEGERVWHHYCREQPQDYSSAPLGQIFSSRDMKTLVGPLNQVIIDVDSVSDFDARHYEEEIGQASETLEYPPVIVLRTSEGLFDAEGKKLYSIAEQMIECPLHPIPSEDITDFDLDFNDRCWVIFENSRISVLNSTDYSSGISFGVTHGHEWADIGIGQVPWPKEEELTCVRRVGANICVGTAGSGMYMLPSAHSLEVDEITAEMWRNIAATDDDNQAESTFYIKEIAHWDTVEGSMIALLHRETLSVFDGKNLIKVPVPKRNYTCMVADRRDQLWLGAFSGLLYVDSGFKIHDIMLYGTKFESPRMVALAAAPDDAKYPYLIAVSYDKQFMPDVKFWKSSDTPPGLFPDRRNPYRLHVKNPEIDGSRVLLWDGVDWEKMSRPGVNALMFDQLYLWTATSNRIMRIYVPVDQFKY
jgi:hypothetical protein